MVEVIIERKILEYLRDIMPFRWCHLHMIAHTAFLWRWVALRRTASAGQCSRFCPVGALLRFSLRISRGGVQGVRHSYG